MRDSSIFSCDFGVYPSAAFGVMLIVFTCLDTAF